MKECRIILFLLMLFGVALDGVSQENAPAFPPFTRESTFKKLQKKHPFITPLAPVVSDSISYHENVVYKNIGTTSLMVDVYVPKKDSTKLYPAILLIHGGGWLTGSKENLRIMAQHLALNDYVAVTVAYRLGLETPYPAALHDLKDALKWMRSNAKCYQMDPHKIAVLGASAGGQLATLLGTTNHLPLYGEISTPVQAIVNIDGIVSFIHPEADEEGKMASIWLNGTKEDRYKTWKEASPLEYTDVHTPPTLFINSAQPRFHAGRDAYIEILKNHHIPYEVQTIPDTPHAFWLVAPWFKTTLNYTVAFLNALLKKASSTN